MNDFERSAECSNKNFKLVISEKNWYAIKLIRQYGNCHYLKLDEWTNIFAEKI